MRSNGRCCFNWIEAGDDGNDNLEIDVARVCGAQRHDLDRRQRLVGQRKFVVERHTVQLLEVVWCVGCGAENVEIFDVSVNGHLLHVDVVVAGGRQFDG